MGHKTRIMYIERKAGNLTGPARIGRVTYSNDWGDDLLQRTRIQELKASGL